MKLRSLLVIFLAALVLAGCKNSGTNQNSTNLRTLHAVPDAEALDILVDGDVKTPALAFGAVSASTNFNSGTRALKARSATNGAILLERSQALGSSANYTMVLVGKRASINNLMLLDDITAPASGKFKVRSAGFTPDVGAVDVYVVPGAITDVSATIGGVGFSIVSDYIELAAGNYRIVFTAGGTKDVVFEAPARAFADGGKYTVGVFPSVGGRLANAIVLTPDSGTVINNTQARIKAVNAIPDSPSLNFKVDATTPFSNVPYQGVSSYVNATVGSRSLQIEASNVPGTNLATLTKQLDAARDYTVVAVGTLAAPSVVALNDDNSFPATNFAKVRFVNLRADTVAVDVLLNFVSQATAIAPRTASAYYPLAAATTYSVSFTTPGGVTVLATLDTGNLESAGVYSVYLFGNTAGTAAKLVRDR